MNATAPIEFPEVAAGIAWLDEHVPGWAARVDLKRLALNSGRDCVICQVAGIAEYSPARRTLKLGLFQAADLGFVYQGSHRTPSRDWYAHAEAQWRRAIIERTAA